MSNPELTRINKYLSEIGYCSRRAADKLIEQGRVTINGKIPEMGTKISNEEVPSQSFVQLHENERMGKLV